MADSPEHYMTGLGLSQYVYGAERLGLPARDVLKACGLDPALAMQPAHRISAQQYEDFIVKLALDSADEYLGFHIGHQVMPAIYGALPALAFSAATGRDAMMAGLRYQALAGGTVEGFEVRETDAGLLLTWSMVHQNPLMRRHVVDNVFALLAHMLRFILGSQSVSALRVALEYPAPPAEMRRTMEQLYGCPVEFGADANQILLGADILDVPLSMYGAEQLQVAEELARKQLAALQQSQDWLAQVRLQMRDLMAARSPRRETVAQRLGISVRTLDRRLADAGLTWQRLLDNMRAQLAREYLADPQLSVQAIATRLGFADVRAFQRRFRVWTGTTPSDYRNRLL